MRKALSTLCLLVAASASQAADFSIGLSNSTIALDYTSPRMGQGLEVPLGWLRCAGNGNLLSLGMQVSQQINPAFKAAVGAKLFGIFSETKDSPALALGGQVELAIPNVPNLYTVMHLWYAPTATIADGAKHFMDVGVSLRYRVMANAEMFIGYRSAQMKLEKASAVVVQNGAVFGLRMLF